MSRLFAFVANDPDRVRCALYPARKLLVADAQASDPPATFDGWGIGFFQGGEVLLQRRPKPPTEPVDFYALTRDLRTDVIVGHVRAGTVGKPKNENTHPFRFRSWLFAHHGTIPAFDSIRDELLNDVPDFLRRNIRGQTDSEHLFHLLLAFLHDASKLDDVNVTTAVVAEALRSTTALIDRMVTKHGHDPRSECDIALTNGRILLATRRGRPVYYNHTTSIKDCPVCRDQTPEFGREPKRIDHEHLRSVVIVADPPATPPGAPWQEIPDGSIISVSHELGVELTALANPA
jgi:predicted glutamine amidotransferase